VISKGFNTESNSTQGRLIISSAIIPILFLLTAASSSFQYQFPELSQNEYSHVEYPIQIDDKGPWDMNHAGMIIYDELMRSSLNSPGMRSGPLEISSYFKSAHSTQSEEVRSDYIYESSSEDSINSEITAQARASDASGIDIAVMDKFTYNGIIEEMGWYAAAQVGEKTTFTFWLENLGINSSGFIEVNFKIFDYYNREAEYQTDTISQLVSTQQTTIQFDWIPTYSNYYNISLSIVVKDDYNISNNEKIWGWIIAVKWSADFENGDLSEWTGDKAETKWHITDTIQNDPDSAAHSSPKALYHGDESTSDTYGINEDYYLTLPPFDLRRFEANVGTYILYQFYGASSSGDKLILEVRPNPDKDFKYDDLLPELTGKTTHPDTGLWEWQAWQGENATISGIPIDFLTGEIVQFRLRWQSDNIPDDPPENLGFFLDDFLLFGLETPPPEKDAGLDDLNIDIISNPWDMPVVSNTMDISAKIKNYGRSALNDFQVKLSIKDEQTRSITKIIDPVKTIHSLDYGAERLLNWKFTPEICGNFYLTIENLLKDDGWQLNDFLNKTITVAKHYNDAEQENESWESDGNWTRVTVPNDPNPGGHSRTNAWYVGNDNGTYGPNKNAVLKSPILDLQGINPSNPDIKIFTNFRFYGNSAENDILYFEYALDGEDNWILVNDGGSLGNNYTTAVSGSYNDRWYELDEVKDIKAGSTQFIGHSVQFRWRFVSDNINENLPGFIGFYIDDFIVWSIEEDYKRPTIVTAKISKPELENHKGDFAKITVQPLDRDNNLAPDGVTINLVPLGGTPNSQLYDDGTQGDSIPSDGIFSINISVNPTVVPGSKILVVQVVDTDSKVGRAFIDIDVIENLPPEFSKITPNEKNVLLNENDIMKFSFNAIDPGDVLTYKWFLNGELLIESSNIQEFIFNTSYDGNYSAGTYNLNATVSDDAVPPQTSFFEWRITVQDILSDLEINESTIQISNRQPFVGEIVYFNITVKNQGLKPENNINLSMKENFPGTGLSAIQDVVLKQLDGSALRIISLQWTATLGLHDFKFIVDPDNYIVELDENNNIASVSIEVFKPPQKPEDPKNPEDENFVTRMFANSGYMSIILVIIITSTIFGVVVGGTEIGRFHFFSSMLPLYSRMKGTKILSHALREQIYNHIKRYPGDHYRSIMNKLKLKNGTLVHHLTRLEQEELIKSQRDGLYKRFYPIGMKIPRSNVSMYYPDGTVTYNIDDRQVSELQMSILKALGEKPGISQKEISEAIGESRRVVNYHVKLLTQSKLIKVVREGRETKCFSQVDLT
jgi:predicted transcriptional regulator